MATRSAPQKIIWAIDAFEESPHSQKKVADVVRLLQRDGISEVEPVYILSPEQLDLQLAFTPPWAEHYRPAARRAIEQKIQNLNLERLQPPKVLINTGASTRASTKLLHKYARTANADLIIVGSHARKKVARLFLGSFAESLLLQSKIPVLVVSPLAKVQSRLSRILFPTDFEPHSFETFKSLLDFSKLHNSKIIVHHATQDPITPVFQSGVYLLGGGWVPVRTFLAHEEERLSKQAELWKKVVKKMGAQVEFSFDHQALGAADSILKTADQTGADLIAMAAHSGAITATLLGSVTRQVIRAATTPVWVLPARD